MDRVGETESEGAFESLRTPATAADLLLVAAVPAVLLAVATLPQSVRQSLVFEYGDPTLRTAVLSSFVHVGPRHLAVNLVGYALVVPVAYLLSAVNGERWRFRVAFVSLLLVCPVVLPYLNLAIVRSSASAGFSGVLLALYGYLPLALATHAEGQFGIGNRRTTAPLLFFTGLALIALLTLGAVLSYGVTVPYRGRTVAVGHVLTATLVGLLVVLALVVVLYGLSLAEAGTNWRERLRAAATEAGHFELAVVGTGLFVALPFATFPVDPVVGGRVLNLYAHLLGYALGFIATYVLVVLESARFGPS
ncbi:hypothetical protein [Haloarcula onubensis]|uniref:Rhomboid family intramembrane serine protease n=1 Tax=Haloarcula onubensis TaxID=2950539 RepID=A0ABU2FIS4_9EURY|nr:hypothetical protein [Halomicroarcula sp. S3CR25-11]MDS0280659.1 hypothetical protein [Halomicroarcula sp. S3CR25-11]